jgi:hypothetical protein
VFWTKYRAYLFGSALAGLTGGLFAVFISAFNPSAWTPQELLIVYAAILVGGRGNPRGVILGVFVVYPGFIELTRFLPSPASRPEFGPAMRQVLIGLLIILMLRFRPEGIVKERPGVDQKLPVAGRLPGLGRLRRAGVPPEGVPPDGGTPDGGTLASADAPPPGGPPTAAAGGPAAAAGDGASHPASAVRRSAGPARASEGQPAEDGSPE